MEKEQALFILGRMGFYDGRREPLPDAADPVEFLAELLAEEAPPEPKPKRKPGRPRKARP